MTKLADLMKQKEAIEQAIIEQQEKERAPIIASIKEQISAFNITAKELGFKEEKAGKQKPKNSVAPKYQHPDGYTWTGRGKAPLWIRGSDGEVSERLKTKYLIS